MKKVIFALFAVVIAVGGSAFTSVPVGTIYGNTNDINYDELQDTYDSGLCQTDASTKKCAYRVTATGEAHLTLDTYTEAQLINFQSLGYVTPMTPTGLYTGN